MSHFTNRYSYFVIFYSTSSCSLIASTIYGSHTTASGQSLSYDFTGKTFRRVDSLTGDISANAILKRATKHYTVVMKSEMTTWPLCRRIISVVVDTAFLNMVK